MEAGGAGGGDGGVGEGGLGGGKALQWDMETKVSLGGKETCNPSLLEL